MILNQLTELAESLDAEFRHEEKKVSGHIGSFVPISIYRLKIPYKGFNILVKFELGNHNICELTTDLEQKFVPDFEISSRNHFVNLFLRKKNMLMVKSNVSSYKEFITQCVLDSDLESIAKKNAFEPLIKSYKEENIQHIKTEFSLRFDDKIEALKASINFHKLLIDNL